MKHSHILIWLDLLMLPLPVLWRRLYRRFIKRSPAETPKPANFFALRSLERPEPFALSEEEGSTLLFWARQFAQHRISHFGENWRKLRAGDNYWLHHPLVPLSTAGSQSPQSTLQQIFGTPQADVKRLWEPARMHHLTTLALALRQNLDQDGNMAQALATQLQDFSEQVPFGRSVHYASPMEVAIRMVNLFLLVEWWPMTEHHKLLSGLCSEHWHYLQNHLEHKEGLGTNHYLSNLMGLVVAGFYLESSVVKKQAQLAWREFEKEFHKQFFSDGGNFEYSLYYHRLSTEIAVITVGYAFRQNFIVQPQTRSLLQRALGLVQAFCKSDTTLPQFGDNDSGRILNPLPQVTTGDGQQRPCADKSAFILDLFRPKSFYGQLMACWYGDSWREWKPECQPAAFLGGSSRPKPQAYHRETRFDYDSIELKKIEYHAYPTTGLFLYKSDDFYLAINLMAQPAGHRYRGHLHNDKGQLELQVRGVDLIRDPGIYTYTGNVELRNRYRSTRAHFVPFTGREQNRFLPIPLGLFHSMLEVRCRVLEAQQDRFTCSIRYGSVKHLRQVIIAKDHLLVQDYCNRPFTLQDDRALKPTAGYANYNEE